MDNKPNTPTQSTISRTLVRQGNTLRAVLVVAAGMSVLAAGAAAQTTSGAAAKTASPLTVVPTPTPHFRVPRYDTSGNFPQVRGGGLDLRHVNASLREAILADQHSYEPSARKAAKTANSYRGVYRTTINRTLLSASTVVVSALMPATELFPGGSLGKGWLAVTVQVPSGTRLQISDLFANPTRGLTQLSTAWKAELRHTQPGTWPCVQLHLSAYRPIARNYRYFALTPRGLAVGFWQQEACNRLQATVPYSTLQPYLSKLGNKLAEGVRQAA